MHQTSRLIWLVCSYTPRISIIHRSFIHCRAKQAAKYTYSALNAIQLIPRSFIHSPLPSQTTHYIYELNTYKFFHRDCRAIKTSRFVWWMVKSGPTFCSCFWRKFAVSCGKKQPMFTANRITSRGKTTRKMFLGARSSSTILAHQSSPVLVSSEVNLGTRLVTFVSFLMWAPIVT